MFACLISAMLICAVGRASASVISSEPYLEFTSPRVICNETHDSGSSGCKFSIDNSIITKINVAAISERDFEILSPDKAPIINGEVKVGMKMGEYKNLVDRYAAIPVEERRTMKTNKQDKPRGEV